MKRLLCALAAAATVSTTAFAADVAVSLTFGQPGYYGRIETNNYPRPQLVYSKPMIIKRGPRGVVVQPVYLHVRPGQERNWRRYCSQYNACGQPVYFVRDRWYNDVYVSHYRERSRGRDNDNRGDRRDNDRNDRDRNNDGRRDN